MSADPSDRSVDVVIIDTNDSIRQHTAQILEQAGLSVETLSNTREARSLEERAPKLVLLNVSEDPSQILELDALLPRALRSPERLVLSAVTPALVETLSPQHQPWVAILERPYTPSTLLELCKTYCKHTELEHLSSTNESNPPSWPDMGERILLPGEERLEDASPERAQAEPSVELEPDLLEPEDSDDLPFVDIAIDDPEDEDDFLDVDPIDHPPHIDLDLVSLSVDDEELLEGLDSQEMEKLEIIEEAAPPAPPQEPLPPPSPKPSKESALFEETPPPAPPSPPPAPEVAPKVTQETPPPRPPQEDPLKSASLRLSQSAPLRLSQSAPILPSPSPKALQKKETESDILNSVMSNLDERPQRDADFSPKILDEPDDFEALRLDDLDDPEHTEVVDPESVEALKAVSMLGTEEVGLLSDDIEELPPELIQPVDESFVGEQPNPTDELEDVPPPAPPLPAHQLESLSLSGSLRLWSLGEVLRHMLLRGIQGLVELKGKEKEAIIVVENGLIRWVELWQGGAPPSLEDFLLSLNLIDEASLSKVKDLSNAKEHSLSDLMVRGGLVSSNELYEAVSWRVSETLWEVTKLESLHFTLHVNLSSTQLEFVQSRPLVQLPILPLLLECYRRFPDLLPTRMMPAGTRLVANAVFTSRSSSLLAEETWVLSALNEPRTLDGLLEQAMDENLDVDLVNAVVNRLREFGFVTEVPREFFA